MLKVFTQSFIFILFILTASLTKAQNLAVTNILSPTTGANCTNVPRTDSVTVRITNLGAGAASNFDISYRLNSGSTVTETYTGSLAASGVLNYTFSTQLSTALGGVNTLTAFTSLAGDVNRANDTVRFTYIPKISTFPYYQNFETNDGGFTAGGGGSWVWGIRNKPNTGGSGQGIRCWTNGGLTGLYGNSDASYILSPCYDFTNLKNPQIAFKFLVEVELDWETVTLQYTTDGTNWANLGAAGEPNSCETLNWFNRISTRSGAHGWSGNTNSYPCGSGWSSGCPNNVCTSWKEAKRCINMLAGQPRVQFRWIFTSSGTQCTAEGFAIDSLVLGEAPALSPLNITAPATVCTDVPATFTPSLSNCYKNPRWDFGDGSARLSSSFVAHAYKNPGTYTVKLIVEGLCGKIDTAYKQITILPKPATNVSGLAPALCQSGSVVTLTGSPAGGTFYVDGVQTNSIDPSAYALGNHSVVYQYTDPNPPGCTSKDTVFFKVYVPVATIDNLGGQYCPSAPSFKLKGSPAGGTFTIDGGVDSMFKPATTSLGTHTVVYSYADSIGCPASATQNVDINNTLTVTLDPLSSIHCAGDAKVPFSGTPTGGIFYVNGVAKTEYDPAAYMAKAGQDTIVYFYSDGACSNSDTLTVDVIKNTPNITGVNALYCNTANTVNFTGNPGGGIFTLDGAPAFSINPKTAAPGNHKLVYTYADPTYGCLDSAVSTITIDKPTTDITGLKASYCNYDAPVNLNGTPAGGTFTVDNGAATQVMPQFLSVGNHRVIYTYTNTNGCVAKDTQNIEIAGRPVINYIGFVKTLCFNSNPFPLNTNLTGGVYTIDGLPFNGNQFDPGFYLPGNHYVVEYTYVDFTYGCVNSIKDSVFIGLPPAVAINGLNTQYCSSDEIINLSGTPAGGQFTINGTAGSSFNPKIVGPGTHSVKYSYTDANGCSNEIDQLVDVITNPGDTITPGPVIKICRGEKVTLNVTGSLPGIWSTNETTSSITVQPFNTTNYWYKVNDCASYYDTVQVVVNNNPVADFDFTPEKGFAPLQITTKNKSVNISKFQWIFEDGKTDSTDPGRYTYEKSGLFKVKLAVVNADGCVDTIEKTVTVYEGITIPNVFSPNDDGVNDNFGPITQSTFNRYDFKIFNRWGNLVFEARRPEDRWDGNHNGNPAPDGTYFFLLVAENLKEFKMEGTVTLMR